MADSDVFLPLDLTPGSPFTGNTWEADQAGLRVILDYLQSIKDSITGRDAVTIANGTQLLGTDIRTVLSDCTVAAVTLFLQDASLFTGRVLFFRKTDGGANNLTVRSAANQMLDGGATLTVTAALPRLTLVSDGARWWSLSIS